MGNLLMLHGQMRERESARDTQEVKWSKLIDLIAAVCGNCGESPNVSLITLSDISVFFYNFI